ncbi:MAG: ATP-binding protein, partial [Marinospirillum sp.]|uniref:ATP-binding protein n=1 Tax=Marinospirillum sp. TaxID=2183934 RepID=UPI001A0B8C5C
GTWLAQLRRETPDWGQSLAKVINPGLLERKDLSPNFTGTDHEAVMGWILALDKIAAPEFALSEETLKQKLQVLDAERHEATKSREQLENQARRLQKVYQERVKAAEALDVQTVVQKRAAESARQAFENARVRVKSAVAERSKQTADDLKKAEQKLEAFDADTRQSVSELKLTFSQQEQDMLGYWAERESEFAEDLRILAERIAEAKKEYQQRLEKKQLIHRQKLSAEGVDPGIVQQARDALEQLKQTVNQIINSEDEVRAYRKWREQEWSHVEHLNEEQHSAQASLDTAKRERADADARWKEQDAQLKKTITELTQSIKTSQAMIESAESVLKHFPQPGSSIGFPGNIQDLTEELQGSQKQLMQLRSEVVATFDQAIAILNRYDDTQISLAWHKLSSYRRSQISGEVFEHDEEFKLARIPDLRGLLDTDIPQLKEALIDQFASESGSLEKYFEGLEIMASEVVSVSNVLKRKINTDQQIESLSDIRVVLEPRIYEDAMWQPLKEFVTKWQAWRVSNRKELPSDALLRSFVLVADTLRDARVKENIESMIDMRLEMKENDRHVVIRTDADFLSASSTGLTYLAIMTVFMGLTRYLCPDLKTRITWPIDELATLSPNNISHLAAMLNAHNLTMISACPKLDRSLRQFFENKVSLKDGRVYTYESSGAVGRYASHFASLQ